MLRSGGTLRCHSDSCSSCSSGPAGYRAVLDTRMAASSVLWQAALHLSACQLWVVRGQVVGSSGYVWAWLVLSHGRQHVAGRASESL